MNTDGHSDWSNIAPFSGRSPSGAEEHSTELSGFLVRPFRPAGHGGSNVNERLPRQRHCVAAAVTRGSVGAMLHPRSSGVKHALPEEGQSMAAAHRDGLRFEGFER